MPFLAIITPIAARLRLASFETVLNRLCQQFINTSEKINITEVSSMLSMAAETVIFCAVLVDKQYHCRKHCRAHYQGHADRHRADRFGVHGYFLLFHSHHIAQRYNKQ